MDSAARLGAGALAQSIAWRCSGCSSEPAPGPGGGGHREALGSPTPPCLPPRPAQPAGLVRRSGGTVRSSPVDYPRERLVRLSDGELLRRGPAAAPTRPAARRPHLEERNPHEAPARPCRSGRSERSIAFYSTLFGSAPSVAKPITPSGCSRIRGEFRHLRGGHAASGVEHLGISGDETRAARSLRAAEAATGRADEGGDTCCYAKSEKSWIADRTGRWEAFLTRGEARSTCDSPDLPRLRAPLLRPANAADGCCEAKPAFGRRALLR
jgi:hypothetical protein